MIELDAARMTFEEVPPVVLVRTIYVDHPGRVMVYAERIAGGRPNATRIYDAWLSRSGSERDVLRAKLLAVTEARERWGKPERVRFEVVDRRSRRQYRLASTRVDAERSA